MTKRRLFGLLAGLIVLAAVSIALVPRAEAATVSRIVDGDTLVANIDGREETIRLLNIDTPETKHPSKNKQCLGEEATDWLADRLPPGTAIDLAFDEEKTDRYGRLLAAVYHDDALVNAEIALQGLGVPVTYGANSKFRDEVQEAHETAKAAERGLFDAEIDCTMPAKVEALEQFAENITQLEAEEDPSAALEEATAMFEELETLVSELEPTSLAANGLAIYSMPILEPYIADLSTAVEQSRDTADSHTAKLQTAKTDWDAEQKRLREEEEERREAEQREAEEQAEAARRAEQQAEQERERERQAQREAPAQPQPNTQAPAPAPAPAPQQQPTTPPAQNPAPQPPAPPAPTPKKKSSCVPYGPEISYANDGGYTGLRYGMPGGKTFRKCS